MMDFALLGTGHETVPLIRGLTRDPQHRLVAFVADDALSAKILAVAPAARRLAQHAEALNLRGLGGIIIDSSDPEALEVARQLAGNSVAILLRPSAAHGIEFIYQLGLIRDEQPDLFRLYPIRPWRLHPLVLRLREVLQNNALGRIHQLQWQRELSVAGSPSQQPLLTRSEIDEALLGDADLLKFLAGEFDQVTALQTGDADSGIVQASVSLAGPEAAPAQWTCRGTHGPSTWRLQVTGDVGTIDLNGGADSGCIHWQSSSVSAPETVSFDYGPPLLREFLEGTATTAATSQWANDLNRIFDLLEGTHRSLRRKRTVELYFDTPSERSNFKTQMTAVGCGVLLLTLLAMLLGLGAGIVTKELNLPPIIMHVVRVLVFAPLFLFLLLQLGVFLSKPSAGLTSRVK